MRPEPSARPGTRDDGTVRVRGFAVHFTQASRLAMHRHTWHQLSYCARGALRVRTEAGLWVLPPQRALWIPAGTLHEESSRAAVTVRHLYIPVRQGRGLPPACAVFDVPPLLRELIVHAAEQGPLDAQQPAQKRMAQVLLDRLLAAPRAQALPLPLPHDARARAVAEALQREPATPQPLAALARRAGASTRTVQRLFEQDTQLSFVRWRQRLRLLVAIERLEAGASVTDTAIEVGYASLSAFVSAFRREFGVTPGRFAAA